MTEREAVELIRANAYRRSLPENSYHPDEFIRARWDEAWLDPGPSPAGNGGPYAKVPVTLQDCDKYVTRVYPHERIRRRICRELDWSTCRYPFGEPAWIRRDGSFDYVAFRVHMQRELALRAKEGDR